MKRLGYGVLGSICLVVLQVPVLWASSQDHDIFVLDEEHVQSVVADFDEDALAEAVAASPAVQKGEAVLVLDGEHGEWHEVTLQEASVLGRGKGLAWVALGSGLFYGGS